MKILNDALNKINSITKPTKKFLVTIATCMIGSMGKKNMRNMARYGNIDEHTIARQMIKKVDFASINCELIKSQMNEETVLIGAHDSTTLLKAGTETDGIGLIWDSSARSVKKGLEIDTIA